MFNKSVQNDMETIGLKKMFYGLLFLALAVISCWATGESLKLLQPTVSGTIWYVVAFILFILASLGTKWMMDSFNQELYLENRRLRLLGGLLTFLICWLIVSMPTNTHTFFYRSFINSHVNNDITETCGYLSQIKNDKVVQDMIQYQQSKLDNDITQKLGELEAEVMNAANPGFGPKSEEILRSFANMLGVEKIDPLTYKSTSTEGRKNLCDAYRKKILTLAKSKKENIKNSLLHKDREYMKVATVDFNNLEKCRAYVQDETLDLNEPKDIKQICDQLDRGYSTIKNYNDLVVFPSDEVKARYTANTPQTKVRRMLNVYDVWMDFLGGSYPGSFIFWVLLSILVDLGAFVFFNLATKKDDF